MDDNVAHVKDIVHLARLAMAGRPQDVQLYIRRMMKRYQADQPQLAEQLTALLRDAPTRSSPLRREANQAIPVDLDSRLQLVRSELVTHLDVEPIYDANIWVKLNQLVAERRERQRLDRMGLAPTRSVLFTGAPGVGKTLAARWLARELKLPLLTLDLSAVMSSFLGRTGNNVRYVLDYARNVDCILLLDEFDAIAKRRDDATEVGELKRLVTVLLQEIDDWPPDGFLVAATNHPGLLDPAVWRRFELGIEFGMPTEEMVQEAVKRFFGPEADRLNGWTKILAVVLRHASFSEIEREIMIARRAAAVATEPSASSLARIVRTRIGSLSRPERTHLAAELVQTETLSQREAYELTGVSRDTIRKTISNNSADTGTVSQR